MLPNIRHMLQTKGNAIVIAVIAVAVMTLAVIGVATLVTKSSENNKNAENSDAAYFAMEGELETAIYDAAGHAAGHEVAEGEIPGNYNAASFSSARGETHWSIQDRAVFLDPSATLAEDGYDGSDYPKKYEGYMVVPSAKHGDDSEDRNWNILIPGKDASIPLFVDNTSCSRTAKGC